LWWEYISEFHLECYNEVTESCSKNAHKRLGLSWDDTLKCYEKTFYGTKGKGKDSKYQQNNSFFEAEKEYYQKYGPAFFPGLIINNRTYMGVLDPKNVFESVCAGFKTT